ncbi:hypothetical protein KoxyNG13_005580 [Klebsiella pasteurii]
MALSARPISNTSTGTRIFLYIETILLLPIKKGGDNSPGNGAEEAISRTRSVRCVAIIKRSTPQLTLLSSQLIY